MFSWGTPGIEKAAPSATAYASNVPADFNQLEFNPDGVYNLRRMLGALPSRPGQYTAHQKRFDAADIAWFAAGCATDHMHAVGRDEFHALQTNMYSGRFGASSRRDLRMQVTNLLFDVATLLDRAFGGSTMVMHFDAQTAPATPSAPQYLKAKVYLPPSTIIGELPDSHAPLANVVQVFLEHVALHTKNRWERIGRSVHGWTLHQERLYTPLPSQEDPFSVSSPKNTAIFVVHGRPFHNPNAPVHAVQTRYPDVPVSEVMHDNDDDNDSMYVMDEPTASHIAAFDATEWELERISYEERERRLRQDLADAHNLQHELSGRITSLEQEIIKLELQLSLSNVPPAPTTPVRTVRSPSPLAPTRSATPRFRSPAPHSVSRALADPFVLMGSQKRKATEISIKAQKLRSPRSVDESPHSPFGSGASTVSDVSTTSSSQSSTLFPGVPPVRCSPSTALAHSLGYTNMKSLTSLPFILAYAPPHFWYKELSKNGFREADLEALLNALAEESELQGLSHFN